MKTLKIALITVILISFSEIINAQVTNDSELFLKLKTNDSLLFNIGFNTCDVIQFENLIANDFEFYHDKSGIIDSKEAFMNGIKNGLCNSSSKYKSRRELIKESLKVYPLYNNGKLYGAIQKGIHSFYESMDGQNERKGSTAKFSHVWVIENTKWKLKRVLSYDHNLN